ncbi:unnamed protein product [Timema podura]|uniref:Uncharacterized protein n=1 Tax=Timema podura TaxID=61482 RepID=A0ABN7NMM9_TIMPD|nr:unnamed protein product [Timema podura]
MLSPEVLNFSPPSSHANLKKLNNKENSAHLNTIIDSHYYNHLVSVVVPDVGTTALPETITDALVEDCDYYKVENINIKELTNKDFIEAFVKKGRLTVLSENTSIDLDDCAALTPCGHLVLSLSRETYQKLGIEGKPSFFCPKSASRYVFSPEYHEFDSTNESRPFGGRQENISTMPDPVSVTTYNYLNRR